MSVIFLLVPALVGSWVALAESISEAGEELGYQAINTDQKLDANLPVDRWVELTIKGSDVVADAMKRDSMFTIRSKEGVLATFKREPDGRCVVHLSGLNKSDTELEKIGQELIGRVTQRYAYNKVMSEMKSKGFTVLDEEVTEDNSIKIRVSKYV